MPQIVYCQECRRAFGRTGDLPSYCPVCKRETAWATKPPRRATDPTVPWQLTDWDCHELEELHITRS